jgi:thiamine kinase-like enzyme
LPNDPLLDDEVSRRIAALPCWHGDIRCEPLSGGMTNVNFKVTDDGRDYVVRFGSDDPVHLISRANEIAAGKAAHAIGCSPELVYHGDGVQVARFVDGQVFGEADVREPRNLERIIAVLQRFHREIPQRLDGIPVIFWVFQVLRHYHGLLERGDSAHAARLGELKRVAGELEAAVGPVEIVYGHNDLLAANFIDDGEKIWLIDFDYAGFNSPLFDLANLASNNELDPALETAMLEQYYGAPPDRARRASFEAMKCASLLRETLWSMVSELHSRIDMDFADYTQKNLERFESALTAYRREFT